MSLHNDIKVVSNVIPVKSFEIHIARSRGNNRGKIRAGSRRDYARAREFTHKRIHAQIKRMRYDIRGKRRGDSRGRRKIARNHASLARIKRGATLRRCGVKGRGDYSYRVYANGVAMLTKSRYVMRDVTPAPVQLTTRVAARARSRGDVIVPGEYKPRIRYERCRDWPRCYCTCYRRPACSAVNQLGFKTPSGKRTRATAESRPSRLVRRPENPLSLS